jgi:hypothetical protein
MDTMYKNKTCKGLCTKLDDIGMCMGLCSTDTAYVQKVYDKNKAHAIRNNLPWDEMEEFEKPVLKVPSLEAEVVLVQDAPKRSIRQ